MAKIGISINDVIRDYIGQLIYSYEKYIGKVEFKQEEINDFDLIKFFKFPNQDELNKFIYLEAPLEIFGHADQTFEGLMIKLNQFIMDQEDDEENEIVLISREFDKSIPSTLFFLSKIGCKAKNIKFVSSYDAKWDEVDILITANPKALQSKPEDKISVKVSTPYNQDINADYTVSDLLELIKDRELLEKIIKSKNKFVKYEDIR